MRDHIRFHCNRYFVGTEDDGEAGVLSVDGAGWFLDTLSRIQGLSVQPDLCQEDWGVVIFCQRDGRRFWIGMTWWPEADGEWLVHLHQASLLQRLSRSGKQGLRDLIADVDHALRADPDVSNVVLQTQSELT